ncbi:MAG: alpha-1,4-glucan--maltose-1-phosphate maltosyltransferase [Candidatus Omnitrophota bacterium]
MKKDSKKRVMIDNVYPEIDGGRFPIKRSVGESVVVRADVYSDGHDDIAADLLYRSSKEKDWTEVPMRKVANDTWEASFSVTEISMYSYTIHGWVNSFETWKKDLTKKIEASQDVVIDISVGIQHIENVIKRAFGEDSKKLRTIVSLLKEEKDISKSISYVFDDELAGIIKKYPDRKTASTYGKYLQLVVERKRALFSAWYELFPRSWSKAPGEHGTFKDCERLLPEIAKMGFNVLYLPPIHPIGRKNRKGKNNSTICGDDEPGSPWAIGSDEGGHKAVHSQLGTIEDFKKFVERARENGLEVALDIAFQCSPDHPYVKEHPQWFTWRPDGTVQYAENPPKKYEDVLPINFETDDWESLWEELKSIVVFWVEQGVSIFRVDNPHTKPFLFWDWLLKEIRGMFPDVLFLAEAFARPKVMLRLAKAGFSQSYTYFTWRNTKREFIEYITELTKTEAREYFRPNFWTNTPDILPEHLQYGGRPAFMMRLVLAATLSSSYGIYGPAFELCVGEAIQGKEEYLNSEKYEIKKWDWDQPGNLKDFIARINKIRSGSPALQTSANIRFCDIENDSLICYLRAAADCSDIIFVAVNLDPRHTQSGWARVPIKELGIDPAQSYLAHDLISGDKYIWHGDRNFIELDPQVCPAHILKIHASLHREQDFDYFL